MDHATWGARIACQRYGHIGKLLAYGIAGHHAGLANGKDGEVRRALEARLNDEPQHQLLDIWETESQLPSAADVNGLDGFRLNNDRVGFQQSMLARMIFSALVDADFLDTEEFYVKVDGRSSGRPSEAPSLSHLLQRLEETLAGFTADSPVNRLRAEILSHVRNQANQLPGIFSLTVPTGGGKTLSSLAFALRHAIDHGLRRVIYVIPFTSVVEQNAAVFRQALKDLGEKAVLEHHSAFADDTIQPAGGREKLNLAAENWDAPIVVTTAVQFFESLFADRPSRCRKLHNIAGSVVILDEAQTLPLKLLRPCVAALDELALNYRASIVICTATQPALAAASGFHDGFQNVRELAPSPRNLYEQFRRVSIRHAGRLTQEALKSLLCSHKQALCIVNNRRHARALYESVADKPGARHLSTLMYARHRTRVLREVRQLLKKGDPCLLIATSLIEAGVDIDFPVVFRAEAGLDSIAQAAGRCNREGLRPAAESETIVFDMEGDEWPPPPEFKQFAQVFREIHRRHGHDLLSLAAVYDYFKTLYWQKGPLELDSHDLLGLFKASRVDSLPFETVASRFRMIDTLQFPVIVPLEPKAQSALAALKYAERGTALARALQPFIVQLPRQGHDALRRAGAIQPKDPERYGEQFMELIHLDLYHPSFGLHWDNPSYISSENLCW